MGARLALGVLPRPASREETGMVSSTKRTCAGLSATLRPDGGPRATDNVATEQGSQRRPRRVWPASFKLMVVQQALKLPASNRIKPICRMHPGVEPVQVRKWIRNIDALRVAQPTAKLVPKLRAPTSPVP